MTLASDLHRIADRITTHPLSVSERATLRRAADALDAREADAYDAAVRIWDDLTDRSGVDFDDRETRVEILAAWRDIILPPEPEPTDAGR